MVEDTILILRKLKQDSVLKGTILKNENAKTGLFYQVSGIYEIFRKDDYDRIIKQLIIICNDQKEAAEELARRNNQRIKESLDSAHDLLYFSKTMQILVLKSKYGKMLGLKPDSFELFRKLINLSQDYLSDLRDMRTKEGKKHLESLKETYSRFINLEFSLGEIGDLCVQITSLAEKSKEILELQRSWQNPDHLLHPTTILKVREQTLDKDEKAANGLVKKETDENIRIINNLIHMNENERAISFRLEEIFKLEGAKTDAVNIQIERTKREYPNLRDLRF